MARSDHAVNDSDGFRISRPFITITDSDGSRVSIRVFPFPVPMDQLVPVWEVFPPEPAPEPSPEPPSFDYENASFDELWAQLLKEGAEEDAKLRQEAEVKIKSKL
ncbi:uncharacterized protein FIESC28_05065 [Fusarium coffeatum]|uniref:Uncharacterized protein n=1 Tax=Fusarium coffeatum TaxID=231269 RepID=A0A366RV01_9HYPO|nr:uncharacterized protein FIESC28_05065 [Fusarium coffeatum]RBR20913.1 hypothetical protein FIESC28_05065 [Fusarium coffeatum]